MSELGKTPDAVAFVPVPARAIFLESAPAVYTSNSSMQGSASLVREIVKRSRLLFTGANRSLFRRALTEARRRFEVVGCDSSSTSARIPAETGASVSPLRTIILFEMDKSQTPAS